jgi:Tfp pilus assembly protein PilN
VKGVNLLPDAQQRRGGAGGGLKGGAYGVIGVLAVLLVMALVYTVVSNQAGSRKAQAAEAGQEADRYEARAAALGQYGSFTQIAQTRSASVRGLAQNRFDWERFLREVSIVLPDGIWLKEASASVTGDTAATGAPVASGPVEASPNAGKPGATLKGCAPEQSDVATLMVRLRQVYLVEEVELAQALKGPAGSKATVDNCGRRVEFEVNIVFKAAVPAGPEAPEGRRSVPARLGGGS